MVNTCAVCDNNESESGNCSDGEYFIECMNCGNILIGPDENSTVAHWNGRALKKEPFGTKSFTCEQPGFQPLISPQTGRRGAWVRINDGALEMCAGRDGDDLQIRLELDGNGGTEVIKALREIVEALEWAIFNNPKYKM